VERIFAGGRCQSRLFSVVAAAHGASLSGAGEANSFAGIAVVKAQFIATMIFIDQWVLLRLFRPVWWVTRVTGLDNFRLARLMMMVSPVMVVVWWGIRYGIADPIGVLASGLWFACCVRQLRDFKREEPKLRRAFRDGCIVFQLNAVVIRVVLLQLFVMLDVTRYLTDAWSHFVWERQVILALTGCHCTLYALALFVHVIPPGPPARRRREKRDWFAKLRLKQPVPLPV
jgi:hypothetical protein